MRHGIPSAMESPRAALSAAERFDPRGHAIHVALAMLWAFLQSITNAGEGIAWGMLLVIAILRVPRIWWCWTPAFRDPIWWVLVAWFAWTSLTSAWGPDLGASRPSALPDRWLFTPLMLWPVMGRPHLVLGAIAAGGALHAVVALVLSWEGDRWATYLDVRGLTSLHTIRWQFVGALVLCSSGVRWLRGPGRALAALAAALCALGVWILAVRTATAAAAAGCAAAFLRPLPGVRRGRGWAIACAAAAASFAGAWLIAHSPTWQRVSQSLEQASEFRARGMETAAIGSASGARLTMVKAAWDIGMERPVLGGGAGWFMARLPQWALVQVARDPRESEFLASLLGGTLNNAHSALLHAWVEGGLPSVALLATLFCSLGWRLWTQSRISPVSGAAFAVYAVVLTFVPFDIPTTKAPGALIAVCLAISWIGLGYRVAKPIT